MSSGQFSEAANMGLL